MTDILEASYVSAFGAMKLGGPKALLKRVELEAEEQDPGADVSLPRLVERLTAASLNDGFRKQIHLALAGWDAVDAAAWTNGTKSRSLERRRAVYDALGLDEATSLAFDDLFPVQHDETVVISDTFEPWYTAERRDEHRFYWPAYTEYLLNVRGWAPESVASLDDATTKVVERLSDPLRSEAFQSKGLVVGYVQSGKTANFTGVLAKAIDAGYRFIIVLSGTVELLRAQTQRRLDMELVGGENILRGIDPDDPDLTKSADYQTDHDWGAGKFIRFGDLPSMQRFPDIHRLTRHHWDYRSLRQGITALEFEKLHKDRPLYDRENLYRSAARLVVVKKNKSVLTKLVKDLKSIVARLGEIPAIIIDDESDLASINVSDPKKWVDGRTERTAINGLISELLGLLKRSQYIGYTATPFANVFVDPADVEDIFPKDYVISLERPPGYMGVGDFHDIDSPIDPEDRNVENSQEKAFVRDLLAEGSDQDEEILNALDAFVVSGAVKLYREANGRGEGLYRHHTMLMHESVRKADHAAMEERVRKIWKSAAYSSPASMGRLRRLYEADFLPVSRARATEAYPASFDDLKPFVPVAVDRIRGANGEPAIIVNSDKDMSKEEVDFEQRAIWRVLIGGAKLSRGFTIEGLTISYYRRRTKQADTLMQMGRWFGFRSGYDDLVRLFIGRREPEGARTVDLYEAFDAIVRDEEAFREELRKYAVLGPDGKPLVTPMEIPPLVSQHLPTLMPTSRNKMFNAELVVRRSPGTPLEPTAYPAESEYDALSHNYGLMSSLLAAADREDVLLIPQRPSHGAGQFSAWTGVVDYSDVVATLEQHKWLVDGIFAPDLEYVREAVAGIDDCVVIVPQLKGGVASTFPEVGRRSLHGRNRTRGNGTLFQAISDPKHRFAQLRVGGIIEGYGDDLVESMRQSRRAAMLLYPLVKTNTNSPDPIDPSGVVIAFSLLTPMESVPGGRRLVQFKARNNARPEAPIVDKDDGVKGAPDAVAENPPF